MEVKFCENNLNSGVDQLIQKLEKDGRASVQVESCLGYCGDCATGPFALVNDEFLQADSPDELYTKIKVQLSSKTSS